MGIPSYSPTVDVTTLLRSWSSPDRIDKITMAHVRLDMIAVNSLVQPRLEHLRLLESEVSRLRAELDVISPMLDKYHSFHAPIRRLSPEVLLSIFSHLEPGPMPLKDDAPWVLTRDGLSTPTETRPGVHVNTIHFLASVFKQRALGYHSNLLPNDTSYSSHSHAADGAFHQMALSVTGSDRFIPNDLPALEKLDLRMFSDLFYTLQAPRLHTLILSKLYGIPFSRFPSLRRLECSITHSAQLITLLAEAKQLTSLRVDCQEYSDPEMLPGSGVTSNLLELHLPNKVPEALLHISFPLLHSLTFGLPLCPPHDDEPGDVYILDNLHCPRLSTLILNDPTSFLSLKRLLSCPISRLDLVVGAQSVYYALNSTPLPHLEDLRITDKSPWGWWEMLKVIKMKKSLRNVEIKSVSPESIREVFRRESFPNELTISFSLCSGY
ncbi:hypothetical protein EV421DRAFT_2039131 [Armillaria borealis]|uniref:F-box domain-containing protein n=1 Tax=Armillaria borealis TaxID=47425 RepID=A0AA39MIA1_9AGAR|nr:hypothetical protein EV421DRAFT_2039131 [Armillaria borealis]